MCGRDRNWHPSHGPGSWSPDGWGRPAERVQSTTWEDYARGRYTTAWIGLVMDAIAEAGLAMQPTDVHVWPNEGRIAHRPRTRPGDAVKVYEWGT